MLNYHAIEQLNDINFFHRLLIQIKMLFTVHLGAIFIILVTSVFVTSIFVLGIYYKKRTRYKQVVVYGVTLLVTIALGVLVCSGFIGINAVSYGNYQTSVTPIHVKSSENINGQYNNKITIEDEKKSKIYLSYTGDKVKKDEKIKVQSKYYLVSGNDSKTKIFDEYDNNYKYTINGNDKLKVTNIRHNDSVLFNFK